MTWLWWIVALAAGALCVWLGIALLLFWDHQRRHAEWLDFWAGLEPKHDEPRPRSRNRLLVRLHLIDPHEVNR